MVAPLSYAIVGHLIGDFIIQNHWMAIEKKKRNWPCLVHCTLYTLAVYICTFWPLWTLPFIFIPHFLIDRTNFISKWMGWMGQAGFRDGLAPWSSIIVDNVFHIVTLFIIHVFLVLA